MANLIQNKDLIDAIFRDHSEEFISGFEVGKIFFLLKTGVGIDDLNILKDNKDLVGILCKHFGYVYSLTPNDSSTCKLKAIPNKHNCN